MKNNNLWDILREEYENYPEDFGQGISNEVEILALQDRLKVKFSDAYIRFIKLYGSAILPGFIVYGAYPLSIMGQHTNTLEKITNFYKIEQQWPGIEDWYVISDDGSGNPIGIDPAGVVWLSDHDSGFEQIKLADSFEEFLYKVLTDTLYD